MFKPYVTDDKYIILQLSTFVLNLQVLLVLIGELGTAFPSYTLTIGPASLAGYFN
jgi:hypothetical protein